jgi:transposase
VEPEVAIGVDAHKATLAAAAVDRLGRVLDAREFPNDPKGHRALLSWIGGHGSARRVGIESSLSFGAAASRYLMAAGEDIREVPASLTATQRSRRRSQGKSDAVDSVAIARVVAGEHALPSASRQALLSDLRLLVDYRDQLVRAKTQAANRAHADLVAIRPGYGDAVPNLRANKHLARARSLLRGDRSVRAELVRRRLAEVSRLALEIAELDGRIAEGVGQTGASLTEIPGVGPYLAAKILGEVGDPSRIRSKAAFAVLLGTAPLPASSGTTHRHRLNRGGNRQLNWALHYIALVQYRHLPEAKAYMARKREAGKSHKEAMRCLKRHLSNVVYRRLLRDLSRADQAA